MVSRRFREAVKLDPRPQYQIAWAAEIHPVTLSQIITGYIRPKIGDPRVIRIGELVGLKPEECFEVGRGKDNKSRADFAPNCTETATY